MTTPTVASVATKVFEELSKLEGEDRKRALAGALAMLGEPAPSGGGEGGEDRREQRQDDPPGDYPARAKAWMRSQSVTADQLSHVFHTEGGSVELITTAVPGGKKTKQSINVYLLMGIKGLLTSGDAKFDDQGARATCQRLGCFDPPNHAQTIKVGRKNYLSGSKDAGWTLTGPGLAAAGDLIKQMRPVA